MGLLDRIQPHRPPIRPADVALAPDGGLTVQWEDGVRTAFPPAWLRARCPCAACVEEWTGKRVVGEGQVDPAVKSRGMNPVGNYAVGLDWSDGHSSGIYSWDYLLRLRREQEGAGTA